MGSATEAWLTTGQARADTLAARWPELHAAVGTGRSPERSEIRTSNATSRVPIDTNALELLERGASLAVDLVWITCGDAGIPHPRITNTAAQWTWIGRTLAHPALPTKTAHSNARAIGRQLVRIETFLGYRNPVAAAIRSCPICGKHTLLADLRVNEVACTYPRCADPRTGRPYRATQSST